MKKLSDAERRKAISDWFERESVRRIIANIRARAGRCSRDAPGRLSLTNTHLSLARRLLEKHYQERDGDKGQRYRECLLNGDFDTSPEVRAVAEALSLPEREKTIRHLDAIFDKLGNAK